MPSLSSAWQAYATHYTDVDSTSPVWLGTPTYYVDTYVSSQFTNHAWPPDSSTKVDGTNKWSKLSPKYKINTARASLAAGYNISQATADIQDAVQSWTSESKNGYTEKMPIFTYDGNLENARTPSLFAYECTNGEASNWSADGINEIGWCELSSGGYIAVTRIYQAATSSSGVYVNSLEADIVMNTKTSSGDKAEWSGDPSSRYNVEKMIRHEFGHWYGLGDLYVLHGGWSNCGAGQSTDEPQPIMCNPYEHDEVTDGDTAGLRALYPKRFSSKLDVTTAVYGADIAIDKLKHLDGSTNDRFDMIIVHSDFDPVDSLYWIKAKTIWDVSSKDGSGGRAGSTTKLVWSLYPIKDVGATLANVDNQRDSQDLVLSYINDEFGDGTYYQHWITLFDVVKNGTAQEAAGLAWSKASKIEWCCVGKPSSDTGTDVLVHDINKDGKQDMVLVGSRPNSVGKSILYLYRGAIQADGSVSYMNWNWNSYWQFPRAEMPLGLTHIANNPSKNIFLVTFDGNNGYQKQHTLYFDASQGKMTHGFTNRYGPLYNNGATVKFEGLGASESFQFDSDPDNQFEHWNMWVDGTTAYWDIEWQNQVYSHP